jgi:hypothetical protein
MADKDRSRIFIATARIAVVFSILVVAVVALFLIRGRHAQVIASKGLPTSTAAENFPAGIPRANKPAPVANNANTVEVCGYGQVPIDKGDTNAIFQLVGALTKDAGSRWLSALQNSDILRARVAGLILEGTITGGNSLRPVTEQTRNDVVQLAEGTDDPAVYAMALSMCDARTNADTYSACHQISSQQWTRLDPDNAVPWLLLAGEAKTRHDSAAEANAFSHAARAHKVESYSDSVFTFAEPQLPQDVTPLERSYLASEVIGVESAIGAPQYRIASQHCSTDAVQDSDVRQQCDSLAEVLVANGANFLDRYVGTTIGAHAGWPSERVEGLVQERHALMWEGMRLTPSENDKLWTCDVVNRRNAYLVQRAQIGELGAARVALEQSGESVEVGAHNYTQYVDSIKRAAFGHEQENSMETAQ